MAAFERRAVTGLELALILAVACAAAFGCLRSINPDLELDPNATEPLDPDIIVVFDAYDRDPSLAAVGSWFFGDGPQQVHTFRPLEYAMLRAEYGVFGRTVWPYQVVNALLFCLTVGGMALLLRAGGVSETVAALAATLTFLVWSEPNHTIINMICTRSEVLCGLFAVWAAWCWLNWLEHGGRRWLAGYGLLLLAAFLSKEMALGVALALMIAAVPWRAPVRRRVAAIAVTLGLAVFWAAWFKFAENRMLIPLDAVPPGHTFADLWQRLARSPGTAAVAWSQEICAPAGQILFLRTARVGPFELLLSQTFQIALAQLIVWSCGCYFAARRYPRLIWLWACWSAICYLPVLPLHDIYPWYLYVPDLLDRVFDALALAATGEWLWSWYTGSELARSWVARQRRRLPILARWGWRRARRWWRDASPRTLELLAWCGLLLAALPHFWLLPVTQPLTQLSDLDGLRKLEGIARDPSLGAMLHYFIGDDPQGVHTFRPFPAATLWLEWHLWGFHRWPYMLSNMVWFIATAGAVRCFVRRLRAPEWVCWLSAAYFLCWPTRGSKVCTQLIATRHDLTCALFGLLAVIALLDWLVEGRRRQLLAWFGWSMLAYLSKEMAVALVPLAGVICLFEAGRGTCWRKAAGAMVVAVAAFGIYFAWYKVAESNMGPFNVDEHNFGGMLRMMAENWGTTVQLSIYNLCRPLGSVARQIRAAQALVLCSWLFWKDLLRLAIYGYCFGWLLRERRRALAVIYAWKICCYGPVMPLHDKWAWYEYMPHLLDYALLPLCLDVARTRLLSRSRVANGLRRLRGWLKRT